MVSKRWWTTGNKYIDILYPPYTGMVLSYNLIGASAAGHINLKILAGTLAAFFLAVGVGAHCLDEIKGHPLGTDFTKKQLGVAGSVSILLAVLIGIFYASYYNPWIIPFIIVGGFIVVSYNLELFGGFFHNDFWFASIWGGFPALTAFFAQSGTITVGGILISAGCGFTAGIETVINHWVKEFSEYQKEYRSDKMFRDPQNAVKLLVAGVILLGVGIFLSAL